MQFRVIVFRRPPGKFFSLGRRSPGAQPWVALCLDNLPARRTGDYGAVLVGGEGATRQEAMDALRQRIGEILSHNAVEAEITTIEVHFTPESDTPTQTP